MVDFYFLFLSAICIIGDCTMHFFVQTLMRKINNRSPSPNTTSPGRAIELDPDYGLLFYTDWGLTTAHLGRANMDGSDRRSLINNTSSVQIKWPNALTIDHPNKNLYWMDARMKSIGMSLLPVEKYSNFLLCPN